MPRRIISITLIFIAVCLGIIAPVLAFTPMGTHLLNTFTQVTPTATSSLPIPTPTPPSSPTPVLTVRGRPPIVSAAAAYLLDADTGHTLVDLNGEESLPMASTTKIMTAVLAIETADPDQLVTIHQDAYNEVHRNNGSSAFLMVGDKIPLKYLLYALLLPSGDDAAVAIADAVGGTEANFVHFMNIFAYRLHLYQTYYVNPDGLEAPGHHSSAYDLVRLARYAMTLPTFAQIVQAQTYTLPANADHHRYTWKTTNTLLGTFKGATGIKTGTTPEAGFCLVFSAIRNGHHLIGVVLHDKSETLRFADARTLLNWGFNLPLLPPEP
jgi:serine-type D-Ala-D-Ala carboxypeptidase (penicillin-binding protein 5/6)